jgi:FKBP-type peptidyl-prolyl cis-trans isomerase
MKLKHILTASLLVTLGAAATLCAQEVKLPASGAQTPPAAAAVAPQFTEAQIFETLGWYLGKQNGFADLGFSKEQVDQLVKGLYTAAAGKECPYDLEKIGPELTKLMQVKQQAYVSKLKEKGKEESEKFLTEVKTRKGVITLPSGLAYEILKPGTGDYPKATDSVKVFYTGTLVNGNKFDSNVGGEPAEFQLTGVIPGWTEGIQKINKGGKIKLYVPSALAYGEEGNQGIPPSSALVFEVELLDIKAPAPAPVPSTVAPTAAQKEIKK